VIYLAVCKSTYGRSGLTVLRCAPVHETSSIIRPRHKRNFQVCHLFHINPSCAHEHASVSQITFFGPFR
jgi:hypothetical protein